MPDDNMQMGEDEFMRATFFSTEEEVAALKREAEEKRAAALARRRQKWAAGLEFRAAKVFVRALETLHHDARRAWILYLADRYLGMKPRDWTR